MSPRKTVRELGGARAIILHRDHATVSTLTRQLAAIGLKVTQQWPTLDASALGADFIFFDADLGHDEQFPWARGASPMPLIALIGSEAPGAYRMGACCRGRCTAYQTNRGQWSI